MSDELVAYEAPHTDLAMSRAPEAVLAEAKKAAQALGDVLKNKRKPVMMNGEQYLEFEDWQTVGRFYGVTAKIVSTEYVEFSGVTGFQARAVALRSDGMEISAAEAMCLSDEPNWNKKPLFQLRSMAQTRACGKALRNVLAWVVVLAGYKGTPAEEIQDMAQGHRPPVSQPQAQAPTPAPPKNEPTDLKVTRTTIASVSHKPSKTGGKYYTITGEGGELFHTFDDKKAEVAEMTKAAGAQAEIKYTVDEKYGNKIQDIVTIEPGSDV